MDSTDARLQHLEAQLDRIKLQIGVDKPDRTALGPRQFFWFDTRPTELVFSFLMFLEGISLLISPATPPTFRLLERIGYPNVDVYFGIFMSLIGGASVVSVTGQFRSFRYLLTGGRAVLFGITSGLFFISTPEGFGWMAQFVGFIGAMWVLTRSPT